MIKEVLLFTYGDSNDISTWSNVPYLFGKTLEKKGINVRRFDIYPYLNPLENRIWGGIIKPVINKIWPNNIYGFIRTPLAKRIIEHKIKKAVLKYSNADLCIFMTYEYYNKYNTIPSLLYADVTFEMEITERRNRELYPMEKRVVRQQEEAISNSMYVVPLFPKPAETLRKKGFLNIYCSDKYVINNLFNGDVDPGTLITEKAKSNIILFIGNKTTYYFGAQLLIKAYAKLKNRYPDLELHIVAMESSDFSDLPEGVICHGYLHKDVEVERNLYYDLILKSRLICNPTPKWAGISSIMEAMYFYTPFIIAPFDDFTEYIGDVLDCGLFNEEPNDDVLAGNIIKMLDSDKYEQMALNAHEHVKDYSWDNYIDWLLTIIDSEK